MVSCNIKQKGNSLKFLHQKKKDETIGRKKRGKRERGSGRRKKEKGSGKFVSTVSLMKSHGAFSLSVNL